MKDSISYESAKEQVDRLNKAVIEIERARLAKLEAAGDLIRAKEEAERVVVNRNDLKRILELLRQHLGILNLPLPDAQVYGRLAKARDGV